MANDPLLKVFGVAKELVGSQIATDRSLQTGGVDLSSAITATANLSATPVTIDHKLGRVPTGYIVIDRDAAETVFTTAKDSRTISLQATGDVAVTLMFF